MYETDKQGPEKKNRQGLQVQWVTRCTSGACMRACVRACMRVCVCVGGGWRGGGRAGSVSSNSSSRGDLIVSDAYTFKKVRGRGKNEKRKTKKIIIRPTARVLCVQGGRVRGRPKDAGERRARKERDIQDGRAGLGRQANKRCKARQGEAGRGKNGGNEIPGNPSIVSHDWVPRQNAVGGRRAR